jgi:hypothetical protein
MASYGNIEAYCVTDDWMEYVERLEQYFCANGIDEEAKKRAILLSVCGKSTYSLIRSLLSPVKPDTKTFKQLSDLVAAHVCPKPSSIIQRYKFNTRVRQQGESVSAYLAALRSLSEHCEYGNKLEEMLRDRLVCGVMDDKIQRRLLSESDLTYDKATKLSLAMEQADKSAVEIKASSTTQSAQPVHNLSQNTSARPQQIASDVEGATHRPPVNSAMQSVTTAIKWAIFCQNVCQDPKIRAKNQALRLQLRNISSPEGRVPDQPTRAMHTFLRKKNPSQKNQCIQCFTPPTIRPTILQ